MIRPYLLVAFLGCLVGAMHTVVSVEITLRNHLADSCELQAMVSRGGVPLKNVPRLLPGHAQRIAEIRFGDVLTLDAIQGGHPVAIGHYRVNLGPYMQSDAAFIGKSEIVISVSGSPSTKFHVKGLTGGDGDSSYSFEKQPNAAAACKALLECQIKQ